LPPVWEKVGNGKESDVEDEDAGSIFKDAGGRSEQEGLMTIGEKPSVREEIRMAIEDIYEEVQSIADTVEKETVAKKPSKLNMTFMSKQSSVPQSEKTQRTGATATGKMMVAITVAIMS